MDKAIRLLERFVHLYPAAEEEVRIALAELDSVEGRLAKAERNIERYKILGRQWNALMDKADEAEARVKGLEGENKHLQLALNRAQ